MRLEKSQNFVPDPTQSALVQANSPVCNATELHFQEAFKGGRVIRRDDVSVIGFFEGNEEVFAVWFDVKALLYKAANTQAEESTGIIEDPQSPFSGFLAWGPFPVDVVPVYFLGRPIDPRRASICGLEKFLPPAESISVVRRPVIEGLRYQEDVMTKFNGVNLRWSDSEVSWRMSVVEVMSQLQGVQFNFLKDVMACLSNLRLPDAVFCD